MQFPKWEKFKKLLEANYVPIEEATGKTIEKIDNYANFIIAIRWTDGTYSTVRADSSEEPVLGIYARLERAPLCPGYRRSILAIGLVSDDEYNAATTEGMALVESQRRDADLAQFYTLKAKLGL